MTTGSTMRAGATRRPTARRAAGVFAVAALGLAACGGGPSREEAIAELESVGFTAETAECMMDDLERQGFEPDDLTGSIGSDVEAGIDIAIENCISLADAGGLIDGSDEARGLFIEGMVDSGMVDGEQAECIVARLEADSSGLAEALSSDDFDDRMAVAMDACL